jgi:hypothetical protein
MNDGPVTDPRSDGARPWTHTGYAQQIVFGAGTVGRVGELLGAIGARRVLLVTTAGRAGSDDGARVVRAIGRRLGSTFAEGASHVPAPVVQAALRQARRDAVDAIVSFGGGSCADLGKAVSFFTEQEAGTPGSSYADRPLLPHIAIPTTYSGAELTPFFGMTDPHTKQKSGAGGPVFRCGTTAHRGHAGSARPAWALACVKRLVQHPEARGRRGRYRPHLRALPLVVDDPPISGPGARCSSGARRPVPAAHGRTPRALAPPRRPQASRSLANAICGRHPFNADSSHHPAGGRRITSPPRSSPSWGSPPGCPGEVTETTSGHRPAAAVQRQRAQPEAVRVRRARPVVLTTTSRTATTPGRGPTPGSRPPSPRRTTSPTPRWSTTH